MYGICRVGRMEEGKEWKECHISLLCPTGSTLFNLQKWLKSGDVRWEYGPLTAGFVPAPFSFLLDSSNISTPPMNNK